MNNEEPILIFSKRLKRFAENIHKEYNNKVSPQMLLETTLKDLNELKEDGFISNSIVNEIKEYQVMISKYNSDDELTTDEYNDIVKKWELMFIKESDPRYRKYIAGEDEIMENFYIKKKCNVKEVKVISDEYSVL